MNTFNTISEFIGHFHPLLVHLPIGILLIAVLFYFLSAKEKYKTLRTSIAVALFWGMLSAILSCISGFLLSQSGDYDDAIVSQHQWLGIATAVVSVAAYFLHTKNSNHLKWAMPVMALSIIITGHLGGTLTHGEGYLTESFSKKEDTKIVMKPIADIQQAVVYSDIVQPVLQSGCYSCHGPNKQKGKLRLDEPSFIDKGGKTGKSIVPGNISESEIIKRISLPIDNEDHMPPKQKPQLSAAQIELLNWWVLSGADYHKKVAELKQPEKIKPVLASLQAGGQKDFTILSDVPEKPTAPAPESILNELRNLDVAVSVVAKNSNYLSVNFIAVDSVTDKQLQLIKQLDKQIIWLKLGNTKINDTVLATAGRLVNLTKLYLNSTNINDKGLLYLKNLTRLQYLNLSGTNVTTGGIASLESLKNLKQLYLYQSNSTAAGFTKIKLLFPAMVIDTGGYTVRFLATDTMLVKPTIVKQ